MWWFLFALAACGFWGTGYACLKPVSDSLSLFMVQICYSLLTLPLNLIGMFLTQKFTNNMTWPSLNVFTPWLCFWILGYAVLCNYGSWCYLSAVKLKKEETSSSHSSIGIVTVVTSLYPLVTCLWSFLYLKETAKLSLLIPGLFFCVLGASLLSFA